MSGLTKAYLAEITSGDSPTEVRDTKVDVQFNPTTLRVQISNKTAGGQQAGAQARQRPGTGEMQVSFDLVFDTADEGETGAGVSVLDKTKMVERFVRPRGPRAGQEAPPRVVFVWGAFLVQGTMESANIDLDLFDDKGVPLRAKVAVSIKGQDPRWTYTPAPAAPDANRPGSPAGGAARPGTGTTLPAGAPGTQGNGLSPDRIVQAIPGESLAQLAARVGFDPSAWRALADGLANPLNLELGQEVPMPPTAGKSVASGNGGQGGDQERVAASLPLVNATEAPPGGQGSSDASRRPRAVDPDPVRQGHALTAQGGLGSTIANVKSSGHQQGAGMSLSAFGLDSGQTGEMVDRPWGMGVPLRPKFGTQGRRLQREPAPAGWLLRPAGSGSGATGVFARSRRSGCGCADCRNHQH